MNVEKPYRRKQTATIQFDQASDEVFALMCPVREHDWVRGWATNSIHSNSGLVEEDCIFTTPAEGKEAIWITAKHDPVARRLTMYKVIPGDLVTRLDIAVEETAPGSAATVCYEHTALSGAGRAIADQHTTEKYSDMMAGWRTMIHGYLSEESPPRLAS